MSNMGMYSIGICVIAFFVAVLGFLLFTIIIHYNNAGESNNNKDLRDVIYRIVYNVYLKDGSMYSTSTDKCGVLDEDITNLTEIQKYVNKLAEERVRYMDITEITYDGRFRYNKDDISKFEIYEVSILKVYQ